MTRVSEHGEASRLGAGRPEPVMPGRQTAELEGHRGTNVGEARRGGENELARATTRATTGGAAGSTLKFAPWSLQRHFRLRQAVLQQQQRSSVMSSDVTATKTNFLQNYSTRVYFPT